MAKCSECGFLTLRRNSGVLEAADEYFRATGVPDVGGGQHRQVPLCFMRVVDFRDEFELNNVALREHPPENLVKDVINKERPCNQVTAWKFGFTPKEHREMLDRQWMLDFQTKRENEDREWREHQEQEASKRWQQAEERADKRHTKELWIIGGVVTVAFSAVQLVAAVIEGLLSRGP